VAEDERMKHKDFDDMRCELSGGELWPFRYGLSIPELSKTTGVFLNVQSKKPDEKTKPPSK
jgi:hypothetical protein